MVKRISTLAMLLL